MMYVLTGLIAVLIVYIIGVILYTWMLIRSHPIEGFYDEISGGIDFVDVSLLPDKLKTFVIIIEDDNHLAFVIGDVSGKGISAALFMVLAKNTIQNQVMKYGTDIVEAVKEAKNSKKEMYGLERMLNMLNKNHTISIDELDEAVREDIDKFVDGFEQFDDITSLCIRYYKKNS